jgi:hypothetical protein
MCKKITYTDLEIFGSAGCYPKGTKLRRYSGDFVICHQHFYTDGTMDFHFFEKTHGYRLDSFTQKQMNDVLDMMKIISENKNEFYPKEFLE